MRWLILLLIATGCASSSWRNTPHDVRYQYAPTPQEHENPGKDAYHSESWDELLHGAVKPLANAFSPGTYVDLVNGTPPALDFNNFGQVIDSTWFTNRIARRPLTPREVARGPNTIPGPAPGALLVISGKLGGNTPGLVVRDTAGIEFLVKFDPPAYPGLASGAEVVATKLLWAAGYNVPENFVEVLDLERLRLDPKATTLGKYGVPVPLDAAKLERVVTHANATPGGQVRAMFSRLIPGEAVGPFAYQGTRWSDPNDIIRHEDRRSLRGLWVFQAWLNNTAAASSNSLDVFVANPSRPGFGHLRHYLIDFGNALGSDGIDPKYIGQGFQNRIDLVEIGKHLFSAGIHYPYWLGARRSPFRSIGVFEAVKFEPDRWRPDWPNPAFNNANALDTYWAASILARFDRAHIAAAVREAAYTEAGAARWVRQVLGERRRRLLQHAFSAVLPLDDAEVRNDYTLFMVDLAVTAGLSVAKRQEYKFSVRWNLSGQEDLTLGEGASDEPIVDLREVVTALEKRGAGSIREQPFITVRWWTDSKDRYVDVHLRVTSGRILPVGLERSVQ